MGILPFQQKERILAILGIYIKNVLTIADAPLLSQTPIWFKLLIAIDTDYFIVRMDWAIGKHHFHLALDSPIWSKSPKGILCVGKEADKAIPIPDIFHSRLIA